MYDSISVDNTSQKLINIFFFTLASLILIVIAGVRYNVGSDYQLYLRLQIPEVLNGITFRVEPLYREVIKFGHSLGNDQWIFVITHLIIVIFFLLSYLEFSTIFWLSLSIFLLSGVFNNSLNIMRQTIAAAIVIWGFRFIYKRNLIMYIGSIVIAYFFHATAVLLAPFYFLTRIKFSITRMITVLLIAVLFRAPARIALEYLSNRYQFYSSYLGSIYDRSTSGGIYLVTSFFVLFISSLIWSDKYVDINKNKNEKQIINFLMWVQTITTIICLWFPIIPHAYRLMYMLYPTQALLLPLLISKYKKMSKIRIMFIVIVVLYFFVFFTKVYYIDNGALTMPYKTIFDR